MIYLYKKTHNVTGLNYLGKTSLDPFKYKGSGVKWTAHIRKHGYDVTTEILAECETNEEIRKLGLYYSQLWNVKNNPSFANLIDESGEGGAVWTGKKLSKECKLKLSNAHKGKVLSEDHKAKLREKGKLRRHPEDTKRKISQSNSIAMKGNKNLLGKRWWTNGHINKRAVEAPSPEWRIGMTKATSNTTL